MRAHAIKYLQSTLEGDQLVILTWIAEMKKFSSLRRYEIVRPNDNVLLCTASTEWAYVDVNTGALKRISDEVLEALPVLPTASVHAQDR